MELAPKIFDFYPRTYPLGELVVLIYTVKSPEVVKLAENSQASTLLISKEKTRDPYYLFFLTQTRENFPNLKISYQEH